MIESKICAECRTPLPEYWPRGLCAQCAIAGALDMSLPASQGAGGAPADAPTVVVAPPAPGQSSMLAALGEYDLIEEIARGGMGIVFKARQRKLDRLVAVKMILAGPQAGREFVQRFRTEAAAAAILQHPNIVAIHDVGVHEGRHYFSMDYVAGPNLAQLVGGRPLPPARAARYMELIAQAIDYAHERGILHRDLKPSNVLIDPASDQPRVTDFGLARRLDGDSSLTLTGQVLGSPSFMPPEQAGGNRGKIGRASDVYALGGILYYLLTARAPFQAETLENTIAQVLHAEPVAPRLLNPSAPRDLETITLKCLEKEPSRRYPNARELAEDLGRFLRGEPIHSRPVTAPEKLWRWCRRKPALAGAIGFALAALLTGLAATSWQWRRAEDQRLETQRQLYAANLNLAQAAWEQNHLSRTREILASTANAPERGFEWCYWQRSLRLDERTLRGHAAPVLAAAFAPGGDRIATAGADRTVKIWDRTGGQLLQSIRGHKGPVRSLAWSPDGRRIVTGGFDNTARVWNASNGAEELKLAGHDAGVFSVAFSPDGRQILTGGRDRKAIAWDARGGAKLLQLEGHRGVIWSVAYSPDGKRAVTASWDRTVIVWNAATGAPELTFTGHDQPVFAAAFSSDGRRIASGGMDQSPLIWDAVSGRELGILKGHTAPVFAISWSRDGQRILTAGDDQTARVWDADGRNDLLAVKRHGSPISAADFSPDGRHIVTGGGSIVFSPDGADQIHPGGGDRTARVWDVSAQLEPLTLRGHSNAVFCARFSKDGRRIVTTSSDRTAVIRDAATGAAQVVLRGHAHLIRSADFSPDGRRIVTGSADGSCRVWDAMTGESLLTLAGHKGWVFSVAYSPDGRRIASAGQDGAARVWDASTGEERLTMEAGGWVWSVAFSPDGRRIVTGNEDRDLTAKIWDAASGRELLALEGHARWVMFAAFSPDARRVVTACADGIGRVYDSNTGQLLFSLEGHGDQVMSARFSPDGRRILTTSRDQTARLWDAASGRELLAFRGHRGWIVSGDWSPEGRRVATASTDHTAKIWEAAAPEQVAQWQEEELAGAEAQRREQAAMEEYTSLQRASMPGGIRNWLILLPIPYPGSDGSAPLRAELAPGESSLRPRAGENLRVGQRNLAWREIHLKDHRIDFQRLSDAPRRADYKVAYAVCYLHSDAGQNAVLHIGSDDQARVYLNGEVVFEHSGGRTYPEIEDKAPNARLKAGVNVLVFKVVNQILEWEGSVRVTDAEGQALKGLRMSLTP